jgi:hypothetical protein
MTGAFYRVLVTVDTETIIDKYEPGKFDNPTVIDNGELVHFTAPGNPKKPAGSLFLKAAPLDVIRWHESSISANTAHTVLLYPVAKSAGMLSVLKPFVMSIMAPRPNPEKPLDPVMDKICSHFWQTTVTATGQARYPVAFAIFTKGGARKGYYRWDLALCIEKKKAEDGP